MAYIRRIYPEMHFVLSQYHGKIDDRSLLVKLTSLHIEMEWLERIRVLVDLTSLPIELRLDDEGLRQAADLHRELFAHKDFMAAVLVNSAQHRRTAETYSRQATGEKLSIRVFQGNPDDALKWLGYTAADMQTLKRFIAENAAKK